MLALMGLLISVQAYAQMPDDDPVRRAIESIQAKVDERAAAAERVLATAKLVDASAAARQRGKLDQALAILQQAELIIATATPSETDLLTAELKLRIAEAQGVLNPPAPAASLKANQSGSSSIGNVPRPVLARYHAHRDSLMRILAEERLPAEALSIVLIESGFNPVALSPKGARGLWQLMPATARRYGMTVEPSNDERIDPASATRAAARYLRDLYRQFNDWPLALAAYNSGEARVQRIINQTGIRSFAEMAQRGLLPLETRNYVPAVLAVWEQMRRPDALAQGSK